MKIVILIDVVVVVTIPHRSQSFELQNGAENVPLATVTKR